MHVTLGHCITLIFATFLQITWNYYLVEALIAISVIYKGVDNNGGFQKHFAIASPNLLAVLFGFGLLHGFGLSTRLQQLPLGDDKTGILLRILSVNDGVAIGQIVALTVMVALLALCRKRASFGHSSVTAKSTNRGKPSSRRASNRWMASAARNGRSRSRTPRRPIKQSRASTCFSPPKAISSPRISRVSSLSSLLSGVT